VSENHVHARTSYRNCGAPEFEGILRKEVYEWERVVKLIHAGKCFGLA